VRLVRNSAYSHVAENGIKNNVGCNCRFIVELVVGIRFPTCIEFLNVVGHFVFVSSM
jgi:hypothetical protein